MTAAQTNYDVTSSVVSSVQSCSVPPCLRIHAKPRTNNITATLTIYRQERPLPQAHTGCDITQPDATKEEIVSATALPLLCLLVDAEFGEIALTCLD